MKCYRDVHIRDPVKGWIKVNCYYCAACMQNRRSGWFLRMKQEEKNAQSVWFITLTYSDENLPICTDDGLTSLWPKDLQNFNKRLRKYLYGSKSGGKYYKYYAVGEYGSVGNRPHYHMILFLGPMGQKEISDKVEKAWSLKKQLIGRCQAEPAGIGSYGYVAGYIVGAEDHYKWKQMEKENIRSFAHMSKGLGLNYIETHGEYHKSDINKSYVIIEGGIKVPLPRYYKDKLYTKEERALQAIKLNVMEVNKLKGLSPQELAERERVSPDQISTYERLSRAKTKYNRQI